MGPLFVHLFWTIIAIPIGLIGGTVVSFIGIPLYYRWKKIPPEKRRFRLLFKIALTLALALCCVVGVNVLLVALEGYALYQWNDYYAGSGVFEEFRTPLMFPYEMRMMDVVDYASLVKTEGLGKEDDPDKGLFPEVKPQLYDIRQYATGDSLVVGFMTSRWDFETRTEGTDTSWFWFNCRDGRAIVFQTREEYVDDLPSLGFAVEPPLKTVSDQHYDYWRTH